MAGIMALVMFLVVIGVAIAIGSTLELNEWQLIFLAAAAIFFGSLFGGMVHSAFGGKSMGPGAVEDMHPRW